MATCVCVRVGLHVEEGGREVGNAHVVEGGRILARGGGCTGRGGG